MELLEWEKEESATKGKKTQSVWERLSNSNTALLFITETVFVFDWFWCLHHKLNWRKLKCVNCIGVQIWCNIPSIFEGKGNTHIGCVVYAMEKEKKTNNKMNNGCRHIHIQYRCAEHGIVGGVAPWDMVHVFQQPFVHASPDVLWRIQAEKSGTVPHSQSHTHTHIHSIHTLCSITRVVWRSIGTSSQYNSMKQMSIEASVASVSSGENCVIQFAVHSMNKQNIVLPNTFIERVTWNTANVIIVKMLGLVYSYIPQGFGDWRECFDGDTALSINTII